MENIKEINIKHWIYFSDDIINFENFDPNFKLNFDLNFK